MKIRLRVAIAALVVGGLGLAPAVSQAQHCSDGCGAVTYISGFGGFAQLDDQASDGLDRDLDTDFDGGYVLGVAAGIDLEGPLRVEGEFAYRNNDVNDVLFNGGDPGAEFGDIESFSVMLNLIADGSLMDGRLRPYIGGGVGFAFVDANFGYGAAGAQLNGEDSGFAFQGMAGVSTTIRENMELFVEYRFFGVDSPQLNRFGGAAGQPTLPGPADVILDSEYITHGVNVGLRVYDW